MNVNKPKTAQSLYEKLTSDRDPHLTRGRKASQITLPALLPPEKSNGSTSLYVPYQSTGAKGTNSLANKMTTSLMPPNAPFFRFLMDEQTKLEAAQDPEQKAEVDKALGTLERSIMVKVEQLATRPVFTEAFKHLIVTGNVLLKFDSKGKPRIYRLDSYVVRRSPDGVVLDVLTREEVAFGALDEEVQAIVVAASDNKAEEWTDDKLVLVYNHAKRKGKRQVVYQEVMGQKVPGSEGSYPEDAPRFLPLRWVSQDGTSYGRSHVEEYIGDLNQLEGLSKDLAEGSAASAKLLLGVRPGSPVGSKIKSLSNMANGSFFPGSEGDIWALQTNKASDLGITQQQVQELKRDLAQVFLMNTSVQRQAERVTAEEIRFMAGELESAFGGIYSLMSQEFQMPFVKIIMRVMQKSGDLPTLPKDLVTPTVVTGTEALGRGQDLDRLDLLLARIKELGEPALAMLNINDLLTRLATSLAIDTDGLIKTEEQLQAEQQEQQAMMEQQQLAEVAKSAAGPAVNAMAAQGQPTQ